MKNQLFGIGAGAIVLYALFSGGSNDRNEQADAIAKWKLNDQQAVVMRDCKASMSRYDRRFKESVGNLSGCACMAQRTRGTRPDSYPHASTIIDKMIDASVRKENNRVLFAAIQKEKKLEGVSTDERLTLFKSAWDAMRYCSAVENHTDDPRLREIYIKAKADAKAKQQRLQERRQQQQN